MWFHKDIFRIILGFCGWCLLHHIQEIHGYTTGRYWQKRHHLTSPVTCPSSLSYKLSTGSPDPTIASPSDEMMSCATCSFTPRAYCRNKITNKDENTENSCKDLLDWFLYSTHGSRKDWEFKVNGQLNSIIHWILWISIILEKATKYLQMVMYII